MPLSITTSLLVVKTLLILEHIRSKSEYFNLRFHLQKFFFLYIYIYISCTVYNGENTSKKDIIIPN